MINMFKLTVISDYNRDKMPDTFIVKDNHFYLSVN